MRIETKANVNIKGDYIMKKIFTTAVILFIFPMLLMASNFESQVEDLCKKGGVENCKKAVEIATNALAQNPDGYTENWVMARALRDYADFCKREKISGWEEICKTKGKVAMSYAEKAISLNPKRVEGHFWYGCSVGTYADGVSILTALSEGLKSKTQSGFETAYKIDKMYGHGGPIKALGRFWLVLPFPLRDKSKALSLLEEFNKAFPNDEQGMVFYGEALIAKGKKKEARAVLQRAAAANDPYYQAEAKKLLADL